MGLETATFISDLQPANPGTSDLVSQGDDHFRLVKQVLQNTFPTSSKAWYNPTTQNKSADFTVVAADMNKTFMLDTSGGIVNMTLPTLAGGDAGWECFMIKIATSTNPVLIKPPSGTLTSGSIAGLTAARRCIVGSRIRCFWSGSVWLISRSEGCGGPIGSAIDLHVAALPVGFEWPVGQTLASAATNYPEFNAINGSGVTLDVRGRLGIPLDNLGGSSANRLAGGIITGTAVGNTGGSDTRTLVTGNLPPYTPTGSIANGAINLGGAITGAAGVNAPTGAGPPVPNGTLASPSQGTSTFTGTAQGGTSTAFGLLQPSIMISKVLVVE